MFGGNWGRGFASEEAARAAVVDGFNRIDLEEIVPFTVPANVRSTRVMERLGLTHDPADDFDHPGWRSTIAFVATSPIGSNALIWKAANESGQVT